jgi:hypothetical protein
VTAAIQNVRLVMTTAMARGVPPGKLLAAIGVPPQALIAGDGRIAVLAAGDALADPADPPSPPHLPRTEGAGGLDPDPERRISGARHGHGLPWRVLPHSVRRRSST